MNKTMTIIVGDRYADTVMSIVKCYTERYTRQMNSKGGETITFQLSHRMVEPCREAVEVYASSVSIR